MNNPTQIPDTTEEIYIPPWKKNVLRKKIFFIVIIIGAFGSFARTPLVVILKFFDPINYLIIFSFMFIYFLDIIRRGGKLNGLERIYLSIIFLMPLYSATVSHWLWGQPFLYGIMTTQLWFYSGISFIIFYYLKTEKITVEQLRDIFLTIPWIQLPIYLIMGLIMSPHNYIKTSFAYCTAVKGCGFMFDIWLICFAYFYYFIQYTRTNKLKYLLFVTIFLSYMVFEYQQRALTAVIILVTMLYFLFNVPFKKKLYYIGIFLSVIIFLFGFLYIFKPDTVTRITNMYGAALDVLQGEESGDRSADSRLKQVLYASLFYAKQPMALVFGNGKWNDNWDKSPQSMFGRFYPSDIGILGAYFLYGIFGLLLIQFEFFLALRWIRKVKLTATQPFFLALKYYLLVYYLRSFPTGGSYFYPGAGITSIIITVIYFHYYREKHKEIYLLNR